MAKTFNMIAALTALALGLTVAATPAHAAECHLIRIG